MSVIHFGFLMAGAAAISLPIWIHLLLRQRARTVEIGSIRFVQQVVRKTKSRQRIQRWLLLLLRCLAIGLLALLFARPYLPDTPVDGSTREVAVLIDRSASMRADHEDGSTAFERARERALEYIGTLGEQTRLNIGLFDAGGVEPISLEQLEQAEAASTASDVGEAMEWAADVLADSPRKDRELLLLSDLQRRAVRPMPSGQFPEQTRILVEDPAPAVAQNLAIESVLPTQTELRPQVPITVAIGLLNSGAFPVSGLEVSLSVRGPQGTVATRQAVSLAAGGRKTIEVALEIEQAGVYQGAVVIDREDALSWDNQRHVAFEVRHPDRLLLVDGEAGRHAWENETYFLETALRLQSAVGEGPARTFEVERLVWDRGSGFPDLTGFRLIVMANPGRITRADATRLTEFVDDGGNMLMFFGERTTPTVVEPLIQSGLLAGMELGRAEDAVVRVHHFDREHPALRPFADPQHGELRSLQVRRLVPIEQLSDDDNVLIRGRRRPLAVARQLGQGNVVLITTTADRQWNDWPQNRLFVPLVRQLAAWLTGQLDPRQPVTTEVIDEPGTSPGIENDSGRLFVRNIDPSESDIRRMGKDEFFEISGLPVDPEEESTEQGEEFVPAGVSRSDEKWPLVVWTLLGLLGAEILLASRVHE